MSLSTLKENLSFSFLFNVTLKETLLVLELYKKNNRLQIDFCFHFFFLPLFFSKSAVLLIPNKNVVIK